jgi:hypothetical protein
MNAQIIQHSDDGFIVAAFDGKIWIAIATTHSKLLADLIVKQIERSQK